MDDFNEDSKLVSNTSNFLTDILDAVLREDADSVYLRAGDVPLFRKKYGEVNLPGFDEPLDKEEFLDALEALELQEDISGTVPWVHRSDDFAPETFMVQNANHGRSLNGSYSALRFERRRNWVFTAYNRNPDGSLDIQKF